MTCEKCGAEIGQGAKFCPGCGASLAAAGQTVENTARRPGRGHRLCISLLLMWTAFALGIVVATSATVGNPQENPGAVLGWGIGMGIMLAVWAFGAVVLAVVALAVKPSSSVPWPRSTKWIAGVLTVLAFMWPFITTREASNLNAPAPSSSAATTAPNWQVAISKSPMDGSETVTLTLDSENKFQGWLEQHRATLVLRCQEKKTDVYVVTGTQASVESADDTHTVRLRFDQLPPVNQQWYQSTDGKGLFAPNGRQLAARLARVKVLTFEFTPFQANPAIVRFHLNGLTDHIGQLAKACGWTPDSR